MPVKVNKAFTLIEVLVSVAILTVAAAVVFPVLSKAKESARGIVCLSQFRQVSLASLLYQTDYDDSYALARYRTAIDSNSANDRTWVQLVLPYVNTYSMFKCPSDGTHEPESKSVFDAELVVGDTFTKYYSTSKRSNIGYNYLYLSPLLKDDYDIFPTSRNNSNIADPGSMILFGDSVYNVSPDGVPSGGGSYLIVPPCRFAQTGEQVEDTFNLDDAPIGSIFIEGQGWSEGGSTPPLEPYLTVGGLWPRHNARMTVVFADGHALRITLKRATTGCEVKPDWEGFITDRGSYIWDQE